MARDCSDRAFRMRWAASLLTQVLEHEGGGVDGGQGLAMPFPAMSWAAPCTGSNNDGPVRSGFRLAEAAKPMPPLTAPARSVRMSPKRLSVTMTS